MNPNGRKFYHVTLDPEERSSLRDLVEGGTGSKERRKRAHILLLADRTGTAGVCEMRTSPMCWGLGRRRWNGCASCA